MATIDVNNKGGHKRNKPNKMNLRVDFTPMVDMNMLLITFFMFCTTLSKPQVMDLVMPAKAETTTETAESSTTTLILGGEDKVYYYMGKPNLEDKSAFKITDYSNNGLRSVLLNKNADGMKKAQELKKRLLAKSITNEEFKQQMSQLKKKGKETVIIKPTDKSSYSNLVNTLDEMQLCNISKYAIVDMDNVDKQLLATLSEK